MKQQLRDACITLTEVMGISWLYRSYVRRKGPLVRVVVFHDVHDAVWFESLIVTLRNTYNVLSPEDLFARTYDAQKINVLVTFDDGYKSWVYACLPILGNYDVKALFFLNSGLLDAEGSEAQATFVRERLLLTKPHRTLSWEGARALVRAGHTIGGHTCTHARLTSLDAKACMHEIEDDKKRIETVLKIPVTAFAYPFGNTGDQNESVARAVRTAGYTHAFTTEGVFTNTQNPFILSRLCIEDGISPKALRRWIEGGYDIYGILKKLCVR